MNFLELTAVLGLDKKDYDTGLDEASGKASSFASGMGNVAKVMSGAVVAGITAATTATVAGTKAFIDGVTSVSEYADTVDKMSQKLNMSATSYQEWDFVMQHAGTSIESMQASIKTLSSAAETGNEAFEKLGLTEEEIASMSSEELFGATITALQNVEDETERTYLASQLLGRGATELGALLNMTAEETEEMKEQAHELGGVLSDEAVKSGAQFQDSLQNMQTAFNGLKNSMLSQFLPSFSTVMDGLSAVFSGDSEGGLAMIKEGIGSLTDKIAEVVPMFIEIGGTILTALATSIAQNAPTLIEAGGNAVAMLIDGLLDNADSIFAAAEKVINLFVSKIIDPAKAAKFTQVAINIITRLATAISTALPQLIPAIVGIITEIIRVLTRPDNLSLLIRCALTLILALAQGILAAIPDLVSVIPEVIANLILTLIDVFPDVISVTLELLGTLGLALLDALAALGGMTLDEMVEGLADIIEYIVNWGSGVIQWFRSWGSSIVSSVSNTISNIVNWFTNLGTNVSNKVQNLWTSITSFFSNGFNTVKNNVQSSLDNVKSKFTSIFDTVKETVRTAIDFIKGLFNFEWSLPKIKLPHFSVTGSLDLTKVPPTIPSVSVSWYKKAMDQPYLLNGATIFGASGGNLLGGGEAGSELVIGTDKLMSMMKEAVGAERPITINVYGAEGQDIRALAKEVSIELQNLISDKEKAYA